MNKKISFLIVFFISIFTYSQELNCIVSINSDKVGGTNIQIFNTLQKSLTDFINNADWTGKGYKPNERINCSMTINITSFASGQFSGTLQVQSSRHVFNSTYSSPVFNYNDKDFNFNYTEFENLIFNPTSFDSNLVSVVSFYCFMIIGMNQDTFELNGGSSELGIAQEIVNVAQGSGFKGWAQNDGTQNRSFLIYDMLSTTFSPFREAMYQYHYEGMDIMNKDLKSSKEKIKLAINKLSELHSVRPNAFLTRVFFDAKSEELISIFSGGPKVSITDLVDKLNKISPLNSTKWSEIKF